MVTKTVVLLVAVLLCIAGYNSCYAADSSSSEMPVGKAPDVTTIVGNTDAKFAAALYPDFYSYNAPGYTGCGDALKSLSGTKRSNVDYQTIPGLKTNLTIPKASQKAAKLLFTWTVRVDVDKDALQPLAPTKSGSAACPYFVGTSYQKFQGKQFHTRLYINGNPVGSIASLTVPGASNLQISENTPPPPPPPAWVECWCNGDPTLTGSCLITPSDLKLAAFPDTISVEVRWYNEMCLPTISLKNMRTLIITVLPYD